MIVRFARWGHRRGGKSGGNVVTEFVAEYVKAVWGRQGLPASPAELGTEEDHKR